MCIFIQRMKDFSICITVVRVFTIRSISRLPVVRSAIARLRNHLEIGWCCCQYNFISRTRTRFCSLFANKIDGQTEQVAAVIRQNPPCHPLAIWWGIGVYYGADFCYNNSNKRLYFILDRTQWQQYAIIYYRPTADTQDNTVSIKFNQFMNNTTKPITIIRHKNYKK